MICVGRDSATDQVATKAHEFRLDLQSLAEDLLLRCDLDHLRNVEGRDAESFGEAEFAVRLGIGVVWWTKGHVFAIKSTHAFNALDARMRFCTYRS